MNLDFSKFPEIQTEKFILRKMGMQDENEVFLLRSDDKVNEFLGREKALSIDDARRHIERLEEGLIRKEAIIWAITEIVSGRFVGSICLWRISEEHDSAELGYELLPSDQGRGIMQEVIPAVIKFGFEKMNLKIIEAALQKDNVKSIKLLEKNKFRFHEEFEEDGTALIMYKLISEEITSKSF